MSEINNVRSKARLWSKSDSSTLKKHFAGIKTRNVDISVNLNANMLLSLPKGLLGHAKPFGSGIY